MLLCEVLDSFEHRQVTLPNVPELPIFTPIPITLHIATTSRPMRREDSQKNELIFPSPPLSIANIELNLVLSVFLKAGNWIEYGTEEIASLGGFGTSANASESRGITIPRIHVTEQSWIPELGLSGKSDEKKQKGVWKQEASYTSTFQITCPPTFDSAGIDVRVRSSPYDSRSTYCLSVSTGRESQLSGYRK